MEKSAVMWLRVVNPQGVFFSLLLSIFSSCAGANFKPVSARQLKLKQIFCALATRSTSR